MADLNVQMNRYNLSDNSYDKLNPVPANHSASHASNGSDPITPQSIGAQPSATAINTGNIGNQSVNHANTAGTATTAGNVTGTVAIANGGTGATTVAGARNNLGLGNTTGAVPIANGGTNATTVAGARNNLGLGNTAGAVPVANGGTGLTSSPSLLTNLGTTAADNILKASPRPGVTGVLPIANGGTGANNAAGALANLGYVPPMFTPKTIMDGTVQFTTNYATSDTITSATFTYDDLRQFNGMKLLLNIPSGRTGFGGYFGIEGYIPSTTRWHSVYNWTLNIGQLTGNRSTNFEIFESSFTNQTEGVAIYRKASLVDVTSTGSIGHVGVIGGIVTRGIQYTGEFTSLRFSFYFIPYDTHTQSFSIQTKCITY